MIPRRSLVTGGVLGGVLGALATGENIEASAMPAGAVDVTDETVAKIVQAINGLRTEVQGLRSFADITPVRDAQLAYLRANGKFPDYIEVGTAIWFAVHDWHVRWQQPLSTARDNLGRYTLVLNQTTVIMRTDTAATYISLPYDNR
jgi:hypothetical protein